jgi:hypothetical protein
MNNTTSKIACLSGFKITARATGEVLIEFTETEAKALEEAVASSINYGDNTSADLFADVLTDALMDSRQIDVYAAAPETVLWIFKQFMPALEVAIAAGKIADPRAAAEFASWEADGFPKTSTDVIFSVYNTALALEELKSVLGELSNTTGA